MKAMLLAAGLGKRMAPLTRGCAKPALPLLDEPLVLRLVRQLASQGVEEVVVNTHAHPETLEAALRDAPIEVSFSAEPELLGSGGGIGAARGFLGGGAAFLVVNADMALDLDLGALRQAHERADTLVTLALRDDPRKRDFGSIGYDTQGLVRRVTSRIDLGGESGCGLFTGVHLMEPRIFDRMPAAGNFEIIPDVYVPALREGERLGTWLQPSHARWWPVGSPLELLDANLAALAELGSTCAASARIDGEVRGACWIGERAHVEAGARVGPSAVIGHDAVIASGCEMEAGLALPGARPPTGALRRVVAFADEVWRDA
jgi:NDP-sugar pyrophosphorylase family protein